MKERIKRILLINFFFIFTFFGFGTIELYISNNSEFWFTLGDILPVIIIIGTMLVLLMTVILFLLPSHLCDYIGAIIWGIALALYLQGNFLPNDYGALTGETIHWENYSLRAAVNTIVWLLIIFSSLYLCKKSKNIWKRIVYIISGVVLATQLSSLLILNFTTTQPPKQNKVLTEEGLFEISSKNNLIVFVVDCFDSELFENILKIQTDNWITQFDDFVYYPDTVGGATRTKYALPYILTGSPYITQDSYMSYLEKCYAASPLLNEAHKLNCDTRLFTEDTYIDMNNKYINNISSSAPAVTSTLALTKDFLKLTAFRYMPHYLKRYFWMYSGDFSRWKGSFGECNPYKIDDAFFYQQLVNQKITINDKSNTFRLYHLMGAHAPYTLTADAERLGSGESSETEQALGSLKIVTEYITQLKQTNVYDNSTIIILADHGFRDLSQNPLFMIKSKNSNHPFETSDFPLSYLNLQTIFINGLRGLDSSIENYIVPEDKRYFYIGTDHINYTDIVEYKTEGNAWDVESFRKTGNIYYGNTSPNSTYRIYKLGETLSFEKEASANQYCISGFSRNEGHMTWSEGTLSIMEFTLDGEYDNLLLEFNCDVFSPPQRVNVFANSLPISQEIITKTQTVEAIIPKEAIVDQKLKLEFYTPDAISPYEVGSSNSDTRVLGLSMHSLCISSTNEKPYAKQQQGIQNVYKIDFSEDGNNSDYILNGWWDQEKENRWTSDTASLYIAVQDASPISMKINGEVLTDGPFEVWANRKKVTEGIWKKDELQKNIEIPTDFIEPESYLVITLKFPEATSPKTLGVNEDSRTLGVFVDEITLEK